MKSYRLCLVLVLACGCLRTEGRESQQAAPTTTTSTPPAPRKGRWEVGARYTMTVELASTVAFGTGPATFDFLISGKTELTPLAEVGSRVRFALRFKTAEATSLVKGDSGIEQVAADLRNREAYFDLEAGRLAELRLGAGSSAIATQVLRQLAASYQLAYLSGNSGIAEEFDTTGRYIVEYSLGSHPDLINKRKQRYVALLTTGTSHESPPIKFLPTLEESLQTVRLAGDGSVEHLDLSEVVVIQGAQIPVRAKNKLHWKVIGKAVDPTAAQALAQSEKIAPIAASRASEGPDQPASLDAARIGASSFKEMLAQVEHEASGSKAHPRGSDPSTEDKVPVEGEANVQRFVAMAAHLRQEPDLINVAVRKIRQDAPSSATLIDALGASGSSASLAALAALLKMPGLVSANRTRILQALARTPQPDDNAIAAMKQVLVEDPYNPRALYALGTYSRRFRDAGRAAEAAKLGRELAEKLRKAPGPSGEVVALRAIANSGYSGAYSEVIEHLSASDVVTRVAGVRALQSMQDERVDATLASRFRVDPHPEVQTAVLEVFRLRPPGKAAAQVARDALSNASPHVRYNALALVEDLMPKHADLRPLVETLSSKDPEAKLRLRAAAILSTTEVANRVVP